MALSELPLISLELWGEICTRIMHQSHSVGNTRVGLTDAELLQTPLCSCGELATSALLTPRQSCLFLAVQFQGKSSPAGDLHVCVLSRIRSSKGCVRCGVLCVSLEELINKDNKTGITQHC